MEIRVDGLQVLSSKVIAAVEAGERVTLTVGGDPVADLIPHARRRRWLSGSWLNEQLHERAADPMLTQDLARLAGWTIEDL